MKERAQEHGEANDPALRRLACILLLILAAALAACGGASSSPAKLYVTEYGLGPDKWATAWLLTRYADPAARLEVAGPGTPRSAGVPFDMPGAQIRRINNRSAFEVVKDNYAIEDPAIEALAAIVHEIEINFWANSGPPEARIVEDAFRALQYRYGRDAVTPECYVAFFDRVYEILRETPVKSTGFSVPRLSLSCEDLAHLAQREGALVPEVPIVDVLSAAAAGGKVIFIDVREPDEYAEAHIPGALNIPIRDASAQLGERLAGASYVVSYCVKDFRGFEMAKTLAQLGVENSVIMRPYGVKGWIALGLPVTGSKALTEEAASEAWRRCLQDTGECLGGTAGAI